MVCLRSGLRPSLRHTTQTFVPQLSHEHWYRNRGGVITVDFGYRFLDLGTMSMPLALNGGAPAGNYTSAFSASEWLLSVRIYEPFASLRR